MKAALDWLDSRTGVRRLVHEVLFERIPGGARWRYVWGSTLTFCLTVQMITGIFLWMSYSPSAQTAWESVYFIQHQMTGGWFLRGLHHFTAHAMNVLLVLHLMQVVIDGAYRAPREVNFWFGLALLGLTLGLGLTGYLLPWDQKGYWATKVATNIAAITPFFGESIQRLVVGGAEYGHHTLTRFFALHAGVLPAAIVALVAGHIALFRKHGITPRQPLRRPEGRFWPDQVLMDAVACLAVLAAVTFLTVRNHGAELFAPADPSEPFSAARPEWYFLFLFEFLKYFPGGTEVIGAMVIPGLVFLLVAAMPLIARWKGGHRFNLAALSVLLAGAAGLTYLALRQDARDPGFRRAFLAAEAEARRVVELAGRPEGIPPSGAVSLLREDPLTQGPRLFARHCASCHRYDGHDGTGQERLAEHPVAAGETGASLQARFQMTAEDWLRLNPGQPGEPAVGTRVRVRELPSAPDLKGFGDRAWAAGILDPKRVATHAFYGGTRFAEGKMVKWVQGKLAKKLPAQADDLAKVVAALSAEAALPAQAALDRAESARIEEGRRLLRDEFSCTDCHQFRQPDADASAPDLTGWGSREWLVGVIRNPAHPRFYGSKNDRMPRFGEDGSLNPAQIGLLADWLRGDWYRTPAR